MRPGCISKATLLASILALAISSSVIAQHIIFVDQSATGADNGSSWADAYISLQDALAAAQPGDNVWVAEGVYAPDTGVGIIPGDREALFSVRGGVSLFGGFDGTESQKLSRNWVLNETILSGDLLDNDVENIAYDEPSRNDNSFHVVWIGQNESPAIVDGFTIQSGQAEMSQLGSSGGGLYINGAARLRNLRIRWNTGYSGGGIAIFSVNRDTLSVDSSQIIENESRSSGGGLWADFAFLDLRHVRLANNRAHLSGGGIRTAADLQLFDVDFEANSAVDGGGLYVAENASLVIVNARFMSNQILGGGGGLFLAESTSDKRALIYNALFAYNSAEYGGAVLSESVTTDLINSTIANNEATVMAGGIYHIVGHASDVSLKNSILWGNTADGFPSQYELRLNPSIPGGTTPSTIQTSLIEAGVPDRTVDDNQTIDLDPLFVDPDGADDVPGSLDDNFRLSFASPAIDAGSNLSLPADFLDVDEDGRMWETLPVDLEMHSRIFDGGTGAAIVDLGAYEYGAPEVSLDFTSSWRAQPNSLTVSEPFPNPSSSYASISIRSRATGHIRTTLYDLLGRKLPLGCSGFGTPGQEQVCTLDVTRLAPGLYFAVVAQGTDSRVTRLIIER